MWQNFHKYYWIFLVTNVIGGRNAKHARISLFYKILVSIFTKSSIGYGRGLLETELPHICTHLYLQKYTQDFFKLFMYVLWTLMQVCVEYQKNFMSHFRFMLVKHKQISFLSRIFALFAYISKNTRRDFFKLFMYVLWTFMQVCVEYHKNSMSRFRFMHGKHKQISILSRSFALFAYISKNTRRDFFKLFMYVLWTFMQVCVEYQKKIHVAFSFYGLVNTSKYLF